jgi:hypothetical protein
MQTGLTRLDALQNERLATADLLPLLDHPWELLPAPRSTMPAFGASLSAVAWARKGEGSYLTTPGQSNTVPPRASRGR